MLRHIRREKPYAFKHKGNKKQSVFNDNLAKKVSETQSVDEKGDRPSLQLAKEALQKEMQRLGEPSSVSMRRIRQI